MKEIKVGILTLVALVAVVYMSLKISSNRTIFGDYIGYRTMVNDAVGIFQNTQIKIAGINSGRIKSIELMGNMALIYFEIDSRIKVVKNSKVKISTVGLLGNKYIEIIIGDGVDRLPEDTLIEVDVGGDLGQIVQNAGEILSSLNEVVTEIKESIRPKDGTRPLSDFIGSLGDLSHAVNTDKIAAIVDNLDSAASGIADTFGGDNFQEIVSDIKSVSNDLREITSRVKDDDLASVFFGEESANDIRESLVSLKNIATKGDRLQPVMDVLTDYGDKKGMGLSANLALYSSPEQLYLVGVSSSEWGAAKIIKETIDDGGVLSTKTTTSERKDYVRYNLQLGRKINNLTIRGGLLYSTGGFGLSYHFPNIGTNLGLDVFDYRKDLGFNIKVSANVRLWNVLYMQLAAEELANGNELRDYSVGFGLNFADNDIKSLIGLFL